MSILRGRVRWLLTKNLKDYDFAFPSSAPVADKIIRARQADLATNAPFYSPIAIATFQPIVAGIEIDQRHQAEYRGLSVLRRRRISEAGEVRALVGTSCQRNASYPAKKAVLVSTNDVRSSNAAAMYLAIGSYVANGNKPVSNQAEINKVMPAIGQLFLGQGYSESWSESSFEDYLALGIGKSPMLLTYESQFLEYQLRKDGSLKPDMVLMYPVPEVQSKHVVVNLTPGGVRLGDALQNDPELQRLAAKHGFRTVNPSVFAEMTAGSGRTPPAQLSQVIDPPRYEILESMINRLAKLY